MVYATAYNPSDSPVTIDDEGRQVGGRTWAPVSTTEPAVQAAFDDRRLIKVERPKGKSDLTDEAVAAFDATAELEKARKAGPDELAEAADDADATPTRRARKARTTEES